MPSNGIAFACNCTSVIDEVYQRAFVSGVLSSGRLMVCVGHSAKGNYDSENQRRGAWELYP